MIFLGLLVVIELGLVITEIVIGGSVQNMIVTMGSFILTSIVFLVVGCTRLSCREAERRAIAEADRGILLFRQMAEAAEAGDTARIQALAEADRKRG